MISYNIESLEERFGAFKMLLLLHQHDDMFFNEFASRGNMNHHTIDKTVTLLEKMNLIERYADPEKFHRRIYQKLTTKGKKVAQAIELIETELNRI